MDNKYPAVLTTGVGALNRKMTDCQTFCFGQNKVAEIMRWQYQWVGIFKVLTVHFFEKSHGRHTVTA